MDNCYLCRHNGFNVFLFLEQGLYGLAYHYTVVGVELYIEGRTLHATAFTVALEVVVAGPCSRNYA
jgi:hypothetical protein